MHLSALHLRNFRLYADAFFEFSPKVNVIQGKNARGKTTILEAVYFLMTGRSFRTSQPSDLIRHGETSFSLDALFIKHGIEQRLRVHYDGKDRKVIYNSTPCSSSLSLLGLLQGSVIHPDDAAVVKGAPAVRRHLFDLQLAQSDPLYVHHITRYSKAMRQRNFLLKAKSVAAIDSWEHEMAHSASYLVLQRHKLVQDLQKYGGPLYSSIGGDCEDFCLKYKAHGTGGSIGDSQALRDLFSGQYQRHRQREMDLGSTLTGPHKDDLSVLLNGKEARLFASEGQQRSAVIALRLAGWECLRERCTEVPMILVDDLSMSLDTSRRTLLLERLGHMQQVFLTTTENLSFGDLVLAL